LPGVKKYCIALPYGIMDYLFEKLMNKYRTNNKAEKE